VTWLLALETATAVTGVALFRGDDCVAEVTRADGTAAELLMPAIDAVLGDAGVRPEGLAAIAVSIGPGSFTGLRVGLATAKGLAFGTDVPLVPVPTLAALALRAEETERPVLALLDARRGEVYAGLFDCAGEPPRSLVPEGVYALQELAPHLPSDLVAVGDAGAPFGPELRSACGAGISLAPCDASAVTVGRLGRTALASGATQPADAVTPRYWRRAEAEVVRTGERFEAPPKGV
jgi:tRNA threonylcarbamoyladenosine biosynthesis protein TsaB